MRFSDVKVKLAMVIMAGGIAGAHGGGRALADLVSYTATNDPAALVEHILGCVA